ncbi:MAG TPA: hypothetical protein VJ742_08580 [Nitrososphaera sp.]|nr:hypothetical protein [Nitrososphaera sp.]
MADFRPFRLGEAISEGQGIAMNQYRLGETVRNEQARAGLEQAVRTGDDTQFKQQFPIEAQQYGDMRAERKAKQLEQDKARLEDMHSLLVSVKDQSSLDMALQAASQRGYDVSQTPRVFGPEFQQYQQMAVADVLGVKGKIEMDLKEAEKIRNERKIAADEKRASAAELTAQAAMRRAEAAERRAEEGPPVKLKPGERMTPDGKVEAIPGSDIYITQSGKHAKDLESLNAVKETTRGASEKIAFILDPKREDAFKSSFGLSTIVGSKYWTEESRNVMAKIDSLKSDLKTAGLKAIRAGGSPGQITEREWPIMEQLIDSLNPLMGEENAKTVLQNIQSRLERIEGMSKETYDAEWSQTQYYKPSKSSGTPEKTSPNVEDLLKKYGTNR